MNVERGGGLRIVGPGVRAPGDPPELSTWVWVGPDGKATAYSGKVELGQGIRTGLAIEVADELRLPLDAVDVVLSDTDLVPWDGATAGSQSTARVGLQMRKAAATARELLLELAANHLDLPAGDLIAREGMVCSRSDASHRVSYADILADQEYERHIDEDVRLTAPEDFTVIGRDLARVDAVSRVTGSAVYAQDVRVDGMLYAAVLRPPSLHARLADVDSAVAELMPGVVRVVRDEDLVAVLAETDEQAVQALRLTRATWQEREGQPSHADMAEFLQENVVDTQSTQSGGSLEEGFRQADGILDAEYFVPYISNSPMEPKAAVAVWDGGHLTVWAGTRRPFGLRTDLARHFGVEESNVRVITPNVGGGFGTEGYHPPGMEAARLAKLAGRPVRVAWTRGEELTWSTFRQAALIRIRSGFKSNGGIVAWDFHAYHAGPQPGRVRRGSETPYDIPNISVTTSTSESPLLAGSYRSLGGSINHFARESHMDEIAAAVGMDPVELRLRNLSHPRFRRVLSRAAERFGWADAKAPSGRGFGAAVGLDVGSYAAICLKLDVTGGEIRLERVAAALDCGLTVNPEGARNQVEGSVVMGMGFSLYEAVEFENDRILTSSFARYRVPRITEAPRIDVDLVGDPETPSSGAGEPGLVPVAAAIANALFDLKGERIRRLPLQRHLR